ncbi:MAG: dephospho-CoA kinase [Porphyromonadaceae bacterium]|nr:dephospho-CoA kinase [Porphyromonadaceae bacterium]
MQIKKPIIIGITGGIGGGKSMFSRFLMRRGELVYDTDMEAKILQNTDETLQKKVKAEFGEDIYNEAGLNRSKLAKIVFSNPEKLKVLTGFVHPAVKEDFKKWVAKNSDRKFLFMECAILFEGKFEDLVDKILVVTAPLEVRIERVMKRDCVDEKSVRNRIRNQMPESEKIKSADWFFDTNNDIMPHKRVDDFLEMLNRLSPDL